MNDGRLCGERKEAWRGISGPVGDIEWQEKRAGYELLRRAVPDLRSQNERDMGEGVPRLDSGLPLQGLRRGKGSYLRGDRV